MNGPKYLIDMDRCTHRCRYVCSNGFNLDPSNAVRALRFFKRQQLLEPRFCRSRHNRFRISADTSRIRTTLIIQRPSSRISLFAISPRHISIPTMGIYRRHRGVGTFTLERLILDRAQRRADCRPIGLNELRDVKGNRGRLRHHHDRSRTRYCPARSRFSYTSAVCDVQGSSEDTLFRIFRHFSFCSFKKRQIKDGVIIKGQKVWSYLSTFFLNKPSGGNAKSSQLNPTRRDG